MTKVFEILQKVQINYFYKANAGLFIFLFFVLFGLPFSPLAFHYSLINGIIQSQVFLCLVMIVWLLYNFKCIDYIFKQLQDSRQSFLFCINGLSKSKIYFYQIYVQLMIYMPVLLYAIAIVVIAIKKNQFLYASEIIIFNLVIVLVTPFLYVLALQQKSLKLKAFSIPAFQLRLNKKYFLYPMYFLFYEKKQMLLVTKIFSLLFLYGFIVLYQPERYDGRPMQLCLLMVAAAHCAIVYEVRMFELDYLEFTKNLPFTIAGRFLKMTAMYLFLLLPECILIFKGISVHFLIIDYSPLILLLLSLMCLFHTVLMTDNFNLEQLIRIVFGILAACFFIVLYNPRVALPLAIIALSFALYNSYYYYFEKQHKQ